ncbi:hypothetical protein MKW92_015250 [Papaver armeniacum]|nr:hypothetical protein MKW92_015250 [Papaver armeniacum]
MADMSVVVIKPKAFRDSCVGDILKAVEVNSFGVRGLKLVRKADCPENVAWSDSCTSSEAESDECTLAMVANFLSPKFELLDNAPDHKDISFTSKVYQVGSNYIYKSKPNTLCDDMVEFFPHGLVIWVHPRGEYVCGNMFEDKCLVITVLIKSLTLH